MSLSTVYFRLVAVIFIAFGIVAATIPDEYIALIGVDASVGGRLWGRGFGAVSLAFGVMFWMMNPDSNGGERRIGAIGAPLAFGVTGLTDAVSVIVGDLPAYGWVFVTFNAAMAALALSLLSDRLGVPHRPGGENR